MKEIKLEDTIVLMQSTDYKDRFKGEYYQVLIRANKLQGMMQNKLEFKPTCPKTIYELQLIAMRKYLSILEIRATIEGIEL